MDRDLDPGRVGHPQAGVDRGRCGTPVLVQLEAAGAGPQLLPQRSSLDTVLPLPSSRTLTGKVSIASSIRARCHAFGVTVVALVPSAGPVPPPISVVTPLASASATICGQMKWTWLSTAPAVRIRPLPAMISVRRADHQVGVDAVHGVRVAGLAERDDPAVADPDVGLDHAPVVEHDRAGDDGVRRALGAGGAGLAHRLADHLAAAEDRLVAARGQWSLFDLDQQVGVGQPDPVAGRRPVQGGVAAAVQRAHAAAAVCVERAGALAAQARHDPGAAERHQLDVAVDARLEPHRGAGRHGQPLPPGGGPVERQRRVGLGEVVVRADLDRPVAGVDARARWSPAGPR